MYGGGYGRPPPQQYGYGQPQYGAPQQYGYPPQQQYGAPPPQYGQGAYGYGGMPPIAPKVPTGKIEDVKSLWLGEVQPDWRSIPYGGPLANQQLYVLDPALQLTPKLVRGEICIGGVGLADEYWRDAAKTEGAPAPARVAVAGPRGRRCETAAPRPHPQHVGHCGHVGCRGARGRAGQRDASPAGALGEFCEAVGAATRYCISQHMAKSLANGAQEAS